MQRHIPGAVIVEERSIHKDAFATIAIRGRIVRPGRCAAVRAHRRSRRTGLRAEEQRQEAGPARRGWTGLSRMNFPLFLDP
jgi:hypothetical protein